MQRLPICHITEIRPMNQVPPALFDYARRLFSREAGDTRHAQDLSQVMERICGPLHTRLAPLLSSAGFDALLGRALKLAARDFSFLTSVSARSISSGSLIGLSEAAESRTSAETTDALVAILANLIWLVILFIGENLGLRKVHEVWPDVPMTVLGSDSEKSQS